MALAPQTGAKRLRELLNDPDHIVVAPGVFDGLTARIALNSGFDALYMVTSPRIACKQVYIPEADPTRQERGHLYHAWAGQTWDLPRSTTWSATLP